MFRHFRPFSVKIVCFLMKKRMKILRKLLKIRKEKRKRKGDSGRKFDAREDDKLMFFLWRLNSVHVHTGKIYLLKNVLRPYSCKGCIFIHTHVL